MQECRDWNKKLFLCIICARSRQERHSSTQHLGGEQEEQFCAMRPPPTPPQTILPHFPPSPLDLCKWLRVICTLREFVCTQPVLLRLSTNEIMFQMSMNTAPTIPRRHFSREPAQQNLRKAPTVRFRYTAIFSLFRMGPALQRELLIDSHILHAVQV